jgi:hypothetical protein
VDAAPRLHGSVDVSCGLCRELCACHSFTNGHIGKSIINQHYSKVERSPSGQPFTCMPLLG